MEDYLSDKQRLDRAHEYGKENLAKIKELAWLWPKTFYKLGGPSHHVRFCFLLNELLERMLIEADMWFEVNHIVTGDYVARRRLELMGRYQEGLTTEHHVEYMKSRQVMVTKNGGL